MTDKLTITKKNESWLHLDAEVWMLQELDDAFKFQMPGFQHTPQFKNKVWDGYVHLISVYKQKTHVGIARQIIEFCESRNYECVMSDSQYGLPIEKSSVTAPELVDFVKSLNLHSDGNLIEFRDYQYEAIYRALRNYRRLILSPTGSGKSFQIYAIARYLIESDLRVLLMVPTVSLVNQMKSDFIDYSSKNEWNVEDNVHVIYAGQVKNSKKSFFISTWQSLQTKSNIPDEWFAQFDAIIVDEVHQGKSKEISSIVEKCINAKYKVGFTGSLDRSKTHKQMLISLFGEVSKVASTKELQERKLLSDIKIKNIVFKYSADTCKTLRKTEYAKEMDFIIGHEKRNKFIRNLALSLSGNTLILFNFIEKHGDVLHRLISESAGDRPVYYVHGGTPPAERESIRNLIETGNDVIVLASSGVFSTGVNVKRIHNIMFTSPTKSLIRVIQSIGRGLRMTKDKTHVTLFDLADDLRIGKHENHTWDHFGKRLEIYSKEGFEYSIIDIDLENK